MQELEAWLAECGPGVWHPASKLDSVVIPISWYPLLWNPLPLASPVCSIRNYSWDEVTRSLRKPAAEVETALWGLCGKDPRPPSVKGGTLEVSPIPLAPTSEVTTAFANSFPAISWAFPSLRSPSKAFPDSLPRADTCNNKLLFYAGYFGGQLLCRNKYLNHLA